MATERWIVAMTGSSGTVYGRHLLRHLIDLQPGARIEVIISDAAFRVMEEEEGIAVSSRRVTATDLIGRESPAITFHNNRDIGSPIASGSFPVKGMVIIPCSMGTLAAVAAGLSDNLIRRAADVTLKERRPLLLVPRETPLSTIHLENMLRLSKIGVQIVPAMPGFYSQPQSVSELVDFLVMKVLDQMGYSSSLVRRWGEEEKRRLRALP